MSERPMPAVKALIKRNNRILVLKTETENDVYWVLPGGRVEYGENPLEALEREIQEEVSVDAEVNEPVGMYYFYIGEKGEGDQIVLTAFEADIGDQEIDISSNPADENITEYRWMTPDKLVEKTSNESLEDLIKKYQN
jgi:8-oxo-dGTP diphosphatase